MSAPIAAPAAKGTNWICGPKTPLYVLKALGIAGALGSGFYTTFRLMWQPENVRWAIVFFYLSLFAVIILSAELNLLKHRLFRRSGLFLTSFTGRAFFYIFMGGLMLQDYGLIPGIWMICTGFFNLFAQCMFSDALSAKPAAAMSSI